MNPSKWQLPEKPTYSGLLFRSLACQPNKSFVLHSVLDHGEERKQGFRGSRATDPEPDATLSHGGERSLVDWN